VPVACRAFAKANSGARFYRREPGWKGFANWSAFSPSVALWNGKKAILEGARDE
jgi:hypothetical protein